MEFAPGTRWNYNNSGYFLLGYIIEILSGKTYSQYVEENFFKPLGMTNTLYGSDSKIIKNRAGAYSQDSTGFINSPAMSMTLPFAAGSIQSTVEDLFKWHQAIHAYKIIKKENLEKAFANYQLTDGTTTDYGYGWYLSNIQESPTIEHGGGINGFLTQSIYLPKEDVCVAVFSNCDCNSPDEVATKIAALTIGKPYDYKETPVENVLLQEYTGVYEHANGEQRFITLTDKQLYSQRRGGKKFRIKAYQQDKFFFESMMTTIEFSRNKKGEIAELTVKGRLQPSEIWKKTTNILPTEPEK